MDKYSLYKSNKELMKFSGNELLINAVINEEVQINKIFGVVLDYNTKEPLEGACIKITDINYNPIIHALTQKDGNFEIANTLPNSIRIICTKDHFDIYSSDILHFENNLIGKIQIFLRKSCNKENLILGWVKDELKRPAQFVKICFLDTSEENISYYTYTNEDGSFLLSNIKPGLYKIIFSSIYYHTATFKICIREEKTIYNLNEVCLKLKNIQGTLNGIITNSNGNPLKNAIVVLVDGKTNNAITFTNTNNEGVYLFYNLSPGEYYIIVK